MQHLSMFCTGKGLETGLRDHVVATEQALSHSGSLSLVFVTNRAAEYCYFTASTLADLDKSTLSDTNAMDCWLHVSYFSLR